MLASVRRKVTRAEGVQAFHRSNPSTHPALLVLMGILDGHVIRAKALIQLGSERHQGAKVGVEQRGKLRRRLRIGVLRLFSRVGLAAAKENPSLEGAFRPIQPRVSHLDFAAAARSMLEAARANVDALGAYGLTPALVEEGATLLESSARTSPARSTRMPRRYRRPSLKSTPDGSPPLSATGRNTSSGVALPSGSIGVGGERLMEVALEFEVPSATFGDARAVRFQIRGNPRRRRTDPVQARREPDPLAMHEIRQRWKRRTNDRQPRSHVFGHLVGREQNLGKVGVDRLVEHQADIRGRKRRRQIVIQQELRRKVHRLARGRFPHLREVR
jgi:hypothetical protein